jgi:hypothetical protein
MFLEAQLAYQEIARTEIGISFKGLKDDEALFVTVDGVANKPLSEARLFNRRGIVAKRAGNIEDVKKALKSVLVLLQSTVPVRTGAYRDNFVVRRIAGTTTSRREITGGLGINVELLFEGWTDSSSIEIFSRVRYASPLEVLRSDACLGAAYDKFSGLPGIIMQFQYKSPDKYGQIPAFRKRDGEQFRPLVVPVLTIASNRNKIITSRRDGKPPKMRGTTYRNIVQDRTNNLYRRGIYKGPRRPAVTRRKKP